MSQATDVSILSTTTDFRWDPASIPPFPAVALRALRLLAGTDTSLLKLCNLIRSDPAVSIAILRVANSPLVAFPKSVTNMVQASMLLGFQRLRALIITVSLRAYLDHSFTPLMRTCWRHSIATAIIAERSARASFMDNDFAYSAAILHDIGRFGLVSLMPRAYGLVVDAGAERPLDLLQNERDFCGIDHCQAGLSLVSAWELPDPFLAITATHHDGESSLSSTASLIPPSCALADALGFGVVEYRKHLSYGEVLDNFPKAARAGFPADANDLVAEIAGAIKVIELV